MSEGALTRREALERAGAAGLATLVASALPLAARLPRARAAEPSVTDGLLQAFADTIIPGRKATATESGAAIHPSAIAGVDPLPGAVETDALALFHDAQIGFDDLAPVFLAALESEALTHGGDFLGLGFDARTAVCVAGLDFGNEARLVWEAAAAIPFTAFCAAALVKNATSKTALGYQVMGLPGVAPNGYRKFSYGKALSRERTRHGSLP